VTHRRDGPRPVTQDRLQPLVLSGVLIGPSSISTGAGVHPLPHETAPCPRGEPKCDPKTGVFEPCPLGTDQLNGYTGERGRELRDDATQSHGERSGGSRPPLAGTICYLAARKFEPCRCFGPRGHSG